MNQFSLLMNLLTKHKLNIDSNYQDIGATEEEITKILSFSGKMEHSQFVKLIEEFTRAIIPFGMVVRKNPLTQHWFITQKTEIINFLQSNPLNSKPRLGATLYIIISICLLNNGQADWNFIQEIRKKKDIRDDLEELEKMNYIIITGNTITIHPNLGYYIDFEQFLEIMNKISNQIQIPKSCSS